MAERPQPGTRPANRRALILAAATELFAERGYEHVSISDIAAEVAVGPSALYRHFPGKEQLLVEVIGQVADDFATLLTARSEDPDILLAAATFGLDHRPTGVLWEREARHLSPASYALALDRIRAARSAFTHAMGGVRPGADSTAALAALSVILSPSFHRTDLPRPAYDAHLAALAGRVLATPLPAAPARTTAATPGLRRASTRESLVAAAVRLFAERTYASVGIEDVAAAVGMAPSSLYHHLPNKSDLLLTALTRADGYLQLTLDGVLSRSADAAAALSALVETYVSFAFENPFLVDVLVTEARNLPKEEGAVLRQDQRGYVSEWVHLLRSEQPDLDVATARVTVQAALMTINDMARSPVLQARPEGADVLGRLARQVLGLEPAEG